MVLRLCQLYQLCQLLRLSSSLLLPHAARMVVLQAMVLHAPIALTLAQAMAHLRLPRLRLQQSRQLRCPLLHLLLMPPPLLHARMLLQQMLPPLLPLLQMLLLPLPLLQMLPPPLLLLLMLLLMLLPHLQKSRAGNLLVLHSILVRGNGYDLCISKNHCITFPSTRLEHV